MRAAIYARVSTADRRQDTENQLAELRRFASVQGWQIVGEYIDHESGGRADRANSGACSRTRLNGSSI
jgi:DNA invertase Pin-like site-specific DNA recombinase